MNIAEIRQKYPQYNDLSDMELAQGLHKKFYSDMDFGEFSQKIGLGGIKPLTDEQIAQNVEIAKRIRPKKTMAEKLSEFLVTNPIARQVGFGFQGIANAGLNPAGYVARAAGIDTKPLEAQTAGERATELAGQYGFDAAAIVPTLGLAASSVPAIAPYVAPLVEGGVPLALTGSTGSALATGIINPKSTIGKMATDILGGGAAGLTAARPLKNPNIASSADRQAVKQLGSRLDDASLAENLREVKRTGRNLLEVGTDDVLDVAQKARQQSMPARKILTDSAIASAQEQPIKTQAVIDEVLGTQGKNASTRAVMEQAQQEARPLFEEVQAMGNLATTKEQLANVVQNNDVVADAVKSVKRSYSSLKSLPDTDARVLIEARKLLSEQTTSPNTTLAYQAKAALGEFDPVINEVTGGKLAQANKIYENAYQFEKATDLGRDVFNSRISPDDLKFTYDGMTPLEQKAARIGLRDELVNKIGSASNENIAAKKFIPRNVKEKLLTITGKNEGQKIIDEAEQAVRLNQNINKLLSGSQTAEKQNLRDYAKGMKQFVRHPWDTSVDKVFDVFDRGANERLARYLTDKDIGGVFNRVAFENQVKRGRIPMRNILMQNLLRSEYEN